MELRDYFRVLRKGWPLVLACVVLGLAAGVGLTLATTKQYQATAQVFVATSPDSTDAVALAQGSTFTQDQVQSYTSFANSPKVTAPVASDKTLKLGLTSEQIASKIAANAPLNKVLVNIVATDHDPTKAAVIANAVANQFITVVEGAERTKGGGASVVKLTLIHPAKVPSAPSSPNKVLYIGLGLIGGLLVGVGIIVLRDVLDNTIKDTTEFDEAGVPVMGVVPLDKRTSAAPVAFRSDPNSARSEAYRQIRTNLQFVDVDNPPRIISITSALPGEGKSTTALNLAAALAEAGSRVCLVEADLRRPSLAKALGLVGDVGFTTALIGKTPVEDVLQNAGHNLAVLTSGPIPPNPSELLITDHARALIQQVARHVDFVIIDTPPLLPVTDGATVATLADATLLVTRTGKTTREQATRSIDALDKVGKRPVGVVFNMVTRGRGGYSYEYGYYYTAYANSDRPKRLGRGSDADSSTTDEVNAQNALDFVANKSTPGDGEVSPDQADDAMAAGNGYRPAHSDAARTRPAPRPAPAPSSDPTSANDNWDEAWDDDLTPNATDETFEPLMTPEERAAGAQREQQEAADPLAVSWPHWSSEGHDRPAADDSDTQVLPAFAENRYGLDGPNDEQTSLDLGAPAEPASTPTVDDITTQWGSSPEEDGPGERRVPWYAAESGDRQS